MIKHADLLMRALPEWDVDGLTNDVYYWYFGSYAMWHAGGRHWKAWSMSMKRAIADSQRRDGAHLGSWDCEGPWGWCGGRIYSTAMCVLSLESFAYNSPVLGRR